MFRKLLFSIALVSWTVSIHAAAPVRYRVSFPEPQHRWMQVEVTFPDLGSTPLELRMSRSSPGRYSLHDFAKNVYDVHTFGADGREIHPLRPDPYGRNVPGHGGSVTVKYKIFGDRVDGTYLAIDATHAHMNMPASMMWAHGLDDRAVTLTLVQPTGTNWKVATQLHPSGSPLEFTAPNLQYLHGQPGRIWPGGDARLYDQRNPFPVAVHHMGTDAELDRFVKDVEKVVR